jgi:hypothetical protein
MGLVVMEDDKYWRLRASEMRERAAHIKDAFISGGFLALAEQYDQLAASGARWVSAQHPASSAQQPEPRK